MNYHFLVVNVTNPLHIESYVYIYRELFYWLSIGRHRYYILQHHLHFVQNRIYLDEVYNEIHLANMVTTADKLVI